MNRIEMVVPVGSGRTRLEDFLFEHFTGLSRMYLREAVKGGRCEVNGRHENVGYRLRPGDFIEIEIDLGRENAMRAEEIPVDVVYEDEYLIVVNKPAGMLVHPTHRDKTATLLNALAYHLNLLTGANLAKTIRPGLIHRLDRETSGLIVVAKDLATHRGLAKQFQKKNVEKRYVALVCGVVAADEGVIEVPIGRYSELRQWNVKSDGKPAATRYRVRERRGNNTLLELEPVTGRTNQLRIHCASIGHPIVGDVKRGGSKAARLCLHAYFLAFRHPASGKLESFTSQIPHEFTKGE